MSTRKLANSAFRVGWGGVVLFVFLLIVKRRSHVVLGVGFGSKRQFHLELGRDMEAVQHYAFFFF